MPIYNSKLHIVTWLKEILPYIGNEFGLLPPIKTLAEMKGCSIASMHKAIKELENLGLVVSKQGYGTFLKNTTVKPLPSANFNLADFVKKVDVDKKKHLYVMILPISTFSKVEHQRISEYLSDFCVGAFNSFSRQKIEVVLRFIDVDPAKAEKSFRSILSFIKKNSVKGIMTVSITDYVVFRTLSRLSIPFLVVDHWPIGLNLSCINPNHSAATKELVYVLASLKHKNISLIDRVDPALNVEIMSGYKSGLIATGLNFREDLVFNISSGFFAREENVKDFEKLLLSDERPTAFIIYTSDVAVELVKLMGRMGLKVPRDFSIVTYCSAQVEVDGMVLSGIAYDWSAIGSYSVEKLIEMVNSNSTKVFNENYKFTFLPGNSISFNGSKAIRS